MAAIDNATASSVDSAAMPAMTGTRSPTALARVRITSTFSS
jgi:hypothetical protein